MLLDECLPTYEFNEIHSIIVRASASATFRAIKEVLPRELSPLVHLLFAIRSLPERLAGTTKSGFVPGKPVIAQMLEGFFVLLAEDMNHEFVLGMIGQIWGNSGDRVPTFKDGDHFLGFEQPGYAKAAINFHLEDYSSGCVLLRTETRTHLSDPITQKRFRAYWQVIQLGSALIRVLLLKAIKHKVENL